MMRNGIAYRLPPLVPRISGTGFSLLPTPTVGDSKNAKNATANRNSGSKHNSGVTLCDYVAIWPTPTARDYRSGKGKTQKERGRTAGPSLPEVVGGQLSPSFVEWLMGFPRNFTETIDHEEKHNPQEGTEGIPESDTQEVQPMRDRIEAAGETSRGLFKAPGSRDTLHDVPQGGGSGSGNTTDETAESLQGMRGDVHALPQQETRDLLGEVLESIGKAECREAMEGAFTETELLELRDRIRAASQSGGDLLGILREQARMEEQSNPWAAGEWPDQPRVESGVPNRVGRLRGLGNAVVPQVAEWIGRRLIESA